MALVQTLGHFWGLDHGKSMCACISHRLHGTATYADQLGCFGGQCRHIWHTWSVWCSSFCCLPDDPMMFNVDLACCKTEAAKCIDCMGP